jgi:uncharacterized protein
MTKLTCPTCRKPVDATNEDLPFCSDRCRIIDLGKWASGDYKISTPIFDPDVLESLQHFDQANAEQQPNPKEWKN